MKPVVLAAVAALILLPSARAFAIATDVLLSEVLASWQGNDRVQFVELVITSDGATDLGGADVVIDGPAGAGQRTVFTIPSDVANGASGTRVLIASNGASDLAGFPTPDFVLPDNAIDPAGGRICYAVPASGGDQVVDCVAWGTYSGDTGGFGRPLRLTPDDRSLVHTGTSGNNRADWQAVLEPTPENDSGRSTTLPTLCGDDKVNQGEACDGTALGGKTCADMGFVKGKLKCTQCHFDTTGCTVCGNDQINKGEQCDGTDLGDRTCATLGFTGGTLACDAQCKLQTADCDATFFVPGGGPSGPECLAEWRVRNGAQRPGGDGRAPARQRCKDGDPECDADTVAGQCTFQVAVCFDRDDDRLASATRRCKRAPIGAWQLRATPSAPAQPLLGVVADLGPSSVDGAAVTFGPALPATAQCTATASIVVPSGEQVTLKSKTTAEGGKPRDADVLRLGCTP